MSKHPQQRLPKEDVTPSKPGAGRGKGRFKPLAPKGLVSGTSKIPHLARTMSPRAVPVETPLLTNSEYSS